MRQGKVRRGKARRGEVRRDKMVHSPSLGFTLAKGLISGLNCYPNTLPPLPLVQWLEMSVEKLNKDPTHQNEQVTGTPLCRQAMQWLEEDTASPTRLNEQRPTIATSATARDAGQERIK